MNQIMIPHPPLFLAKLYELLEGLELQLKGIYII
jgi:hypothetical protein